MTRATSVEREVKLDADIGFELPELTDVLPGVAATRLPDARLHAVYLDTDDLRLIRWGFTLRHRHDAAAEGTGEDGWTLKLPEAAEGVAIVRTELSWPGPLGPLPDEVASMVLAPARGAPIGPVADLVTERRRVELRDAAGLKLAELDDDEVSVMDGGRRVSRFRQVEIEVTDDAPPELLHEILGRMTDAGAVAGDDRPKVVRALGPAAEQGPDVVIPELGADATVAAVVSAAIAAGLTRLIRHDPGVRLGDDPEHVHQARVGTRRLRSDLRTFEPLLDARRSGVIREELGWLASSLGEVRDADVLIGRLRGDIRSLPDPDANAAAGLLRRLALQRDGARRRLLEVLDDPRYLALLEDLTRAAADPPVSGSDRRGDPAPVVVEAEVSVETVGASHMLTAVDALTAAHAAIVEAEPERTPATPAGPARPQVASVLPGAPAPDGLPASDPLPPLGAPPITDDPEPVVVPAHDAVVAAPVAGALGDEAGAAGGGADARTAPDALTVAQVATGADANTAAAPEAGQMLPGADGIIATRPAATALEPRAGEVGLAGPSATVLTVTIETVAAGPGGNGDDAQAPPEPGDGALFPSPGLGARPAAEVLPGLVGKPWQRLRKAVQALGDEPPDEALHEVRIKAKRVRYAAEAAAEVIGKPARQLAAAVADVQGVLGDLQDAVVAEDWLRGQAGSASPGEALVAGELIALQRRQQATCRKAWPGRWQKASRKPLRAWLKG